MKAYVYGRGGGKSVTEPLVVAAYRLYNLKNTRSELVDLGKCTEDVDNEIRHLVHLMFDMRNLF